MKRENRKVKYSYEHGDQSLQHLKDMVSDTPDPEKSRIMSYLRTHCIAACPGIVKDEINPEKSIGSGNLYSDGKYYWNDVFFNYVDRYNIPVPAEFRDYIIQNHEQRAKRYDIEIVSGVPSFSGAAAGLMQSLALGDEHVLITTPQKVDFSFPGTIVVMKAGMHLAELKEKIAGRDVYLIENSGMEDEKIYHGDLPDKAGYLSLLIVK